MFWTRLLSGIVLIAVLLGIIIPGGPVLLVAIGIISLIGLFELYRVFGIEKKAPGVIGYAVVLLYYLNLWLGFCDDHRLITIVLLLALFPVYVLKYPKYNVTEVMQSFFGVFYVAVMLSYIYCTRMMPNGRFLVWLIFLGSWGCDTCAYCVGMLFGKHKMAPILSPKKSIEGAIGGVVGSALLGAIYGLYLDKGAHFEASVIWQIALICAVASIFSMVGDLVASAIKRNYEIKDYGHLIPGHGGIMDRFDSVIVIAPLIYYMAVYLL